MSNYVEQLQKVKKLLTKNTWNKGHYFSVKNNILCFCPHGAAQAICNPEVKKVISKYNADCYTASAASAARAGADSAARAARAPGSARVAATASAVAALARRAVRGIGAATHEGAAGTASIKDFSDLFDLWVNREGWIKEDYIINNINYGNLDLHYLIGIAGLTVNFANHPNTTLEMIYDKLDEAIEFAKIIDQYNNGLSQNSNDTLNKEIYLLLKSNNLLGQCSKELQKWAKTFEDQEKEDLKKKALAKLTPEEIKALDINI